MFAIINDVHIGARNGNEHIRAAQGRFFKTMFDDMESNDIKTLVILGDLFDKRKIIDFKSLEFARKELFDVAKEKNLSVIILLGNHDVYYKSTNKLSSPELLLRDYDNVEIVNEPCNKTIEGIRCAMVPWVTEDNYEACVEHIKTSPAPVLLGHFEFVGFELVPGHNSKSGFEVSDFEKYDIVLSGHYHIKSNKKHVHQLGTQYEMDWGDYGIKKGYHTFDGKNLVMIENEDPLHIRFSFDGKKMKNDIDVKNKYVKVVVNTFENKKFLDAFVEELREMSPADLRIVDNVSVDDVVSEFATTEGISMSDVFDEAVTLLDGISDESKESIKTRINKIYMTALSEQK